MLRASCYNESHTVVARAGGYIKRTYFIGSSTSEYINDVLVLLYHTTSARDQRQHPWRLRETDLSYQPDVKYNIPYSRVN